ncbi:MAG: FtsW/RodA/SpoVE family cell cycle protein [bacterium]
MKFLNRFFQNHDWKLTTLVLILNVIGILTVYSNTFKSVTIDTGKDAFDKQIVFLFVGIILYFLFSKFDYNWLRYKFVWITIYILGLILLIYVLVFSGEIANVHRWISFGVFQLQPAELAKIVSVIISASIFSNILDSSQKLIHKEFYEFNKENIVLKYVRKNLVNILKIIILFVLIGTYSILIFIQPSAGNSVLLILSVILISIFCLPKQSLVGSIIATIFIVANLFFGIIKLDFIYELLNFKAIYFGNIDILFVVISSSIVIIINIVNKVKWYYVLASVIIGLAVFPIVGAFWNSNILKDYQKTRIISYFNPETAISENSDALYQVNRATGAIGSGRLWGKGYLQGTDKVPFEYTDFAFTGFAEEFGFIGVIGLITLFSLLFIRIFQISKNAENSFARVFCIGMGLVLLIHTWASISTNLGLIVNTGVPLPFLSYGGTTLVINLIGLGIVESASSRAKKVDLQSKVVLTSKSPWRRV